MVGVTAAIVTPLSLLGGGTTGGARLGRAGTDARSGGHLHAAADAPTRSRFRAAE